MKKLAPALFALCMLLCHNSFATAPTITKFTPANGAVGTLVTVTGTDLTKATTFTIGGVSAIVISNTAKKLVGMVMPGAVTGAVTVKTHGGTVTTTGKFTVKPTPHPSKQQGNKLQVADDGDEEFGNSVALSANGNIAVVGGPADNFGVGAAWIYTRTDSVWTQGSKLVGYDYIQIDSPSFYSVSQGQSVAISAEGKTVVIGAPGDNGGYGAAWIFANIGGTWTQQGLKLIPYDTAGLSNVGDAVSISADGKTVLLGGEGDNSSLGACWVFTNSNGTWTQQGSKLVGTGISSGQIPPLINQGASVALSADGNTALVGGPLDNDFIGATWVFVNKNGVWAQQGSKLVGSGNIGAPDQGYSVAISANGNTALIGGLGDNGSIGACWVFTRSNSAWTQQGSKLVGTGFTNKPDQGASVALSADGNTLMESGTEDNTGVGAFWIFTRSGSTWTQQGSKMIGTGALGANSLQGYSVALSADGNTAIEGGNEDGRGAGAAWVFVSSALEGMPIINNQDYKDDETVATTPPTDNNQPFNVTAYPNPFSGNFQLSITGTNGDNINIKIYNVNGQIVYASDVVGNDEGTVGAKNVSPELGNNMANGIYLVQVTQGVNSKVIRIVKTE